MHGATPNRRTFFTLTIACVAALAMPGFAAAQPPGEWDGLVLRPSSAVDLLYVRPEASLAGYKRVRLEPLQVSFHQDWNPNRTRRGASRLTATDFDNIKSSLANAFATAATAELARGGYEVVTEADEDVLDVTPFIVDLIITAPADGRSQQDVYRECRSDDAGGRAARLGDRSDPHARG